MSTVTTAILASLLSSPAQLPEVPLLRPVPEILDSDEVALAAMRAAAERLLSEASVDGAVSGRIKSPESLAAKMRRKGLAAHEVLDRVALRVRVDSVEQCYAVMARLVDRYPLIDGSFDDYITAPKANGYQSLHAALRTPHGPIEFQVRTHAMHQHAELGGAAHWRYKEALAS